VVKVVMVVVVLQHLYLMPTTTKQLVVMVLAAMLSLEVNEVAHVHEELLFNIMVAMEAVLSLVKAEEV
jgi:uncharacterized membrane protein